MVQLLQVTLKDLVDISAPVLVEGKQYGFIVAGQVTTKELTREQTDEIADELGIDNDALFEVSFWLTGSLRAQSSSIS